MDDNLYANMQVRSGAFFNCVIEVFHWRLNGVTKVFQGSCKGVITVFKECSNSVFQGCFNGVSTMFQRCFKSISRDFKDVSIKFQG